MRDIVTVPATDLTKGMQTYRRNPRNGRLHKDVRIGDPFTTSGSIQPLAFHTVGPDGRRNGTVVFAPCASVLVGTNNNTRRSKRRR